MRIRLGFIYFLIGVAIATPPILYNPPVDFFGIIRGLLLPFTFYFLALTEPGDWTK